MITSKLISTSLIGTYAPTNKAMALPIDLSGIGPPESKRLSFTFAKIKYLIPNLIKIHKFYFGRQMIDKSSF